MKGVGGSGLLLDATCLDSDSGVFYDEILEKKVRLVQFRKCNYALNLKYMKIMRVRWVWIKVFEHGCLALEAR